MTALTPSALSWARCSSRGCPPVQKSSLTRKKLRIGGRASWAGSAPGTDNSTTHRNPRLFILTSYFDRNSLARKTDAWQRTKEHSPYLLRVDFRRKCRYSLDGLRYSMAQIFHRSTNTLSRVSIFGAIFILMALAWLAAGF